MIKSEIVKEEVRLEEENSSKMYIDTKQEVYKLKFSQKVYIGFKSFVEWNITLIAVLVLIPLWIILAIAIKCESKGPAIFKQYRIGKKRKLFKCYKWRSMPVTADDCVPSKDGNYACDVTKIGKFIRKTSIDELAQLFNVLTGKMSLIGYRPLIPKEREIDQMRMKKGVYQMKPGITGLAQVNGRVLINDEEKVSWDEYYLKNISLWMDLKILFLTIKKVLSREGTK